MAKGIFTCCCCLLNNNRPSLFYPIEAESFEKADAMTGQTSLCIIAGTDEEIDAERVDSLPDSAREVIVKNKKFPKFAAKGTFFFGDGPYIKIEGLVFQSFKNLDGYVGCLFINSKKVEVWASLEYMYVCPNKFYGRPLGQFKKALLSGNLNKSAFKLNGGLFLFWLEKRVKRKPILESSIPRRSHGSARKLLNSRSKPKPYPRNQKNKNPEMHFFGSEH